MELVTQIGLMAIAILGVAAIGAFIFSSQDSLLTNVEVRITEEHLKKVGTAQTFSGSFTNAGTTAFDSANIVFDSDANAAGIQEYVIAVPDADLPIPSGDSYTWNVVLDDSISLSVGMRHSMYVNVTSSSGSDLAEATITVER